MYPAEATAGSGSPSYAIATAARNLDVSASQNVLILGEQFPSNVYSWRRLQRDVGFELRTVERPWPAPSGTTRDVSTNRWRPGRIAWSSWPPACRWR